MGILRVRKAGGNFSNDLESWGLHLLDKTKLAFGCSTEVQAVESLSQVLPIVILVLVQILRLINEGVLICLPVPIYQQRVIAC